MIQLLPYLLCGLLIAQCYLLTQQLNHALMIGRSMIALVNKQRAEFAERIESVEVEQFAKGWEAASEEQSEPTEIVDGDVEGYSMRFAGDSARPVRCDCLRCRERAFGVN